MKVILCSHAVDDQLQPTEARLLIRLTKPILSLTMCERGEILLYSHSVVGAEERISCSPQKSDY